MLELKFQFFYQWVLGGWWVGDQIKQNEDLSLFKLKLELKMELRLKTFSDVRQMCEAFNSMWG